MKDLWLWYSEDDNEVWLFIFIDILNAYLGREHDNEIWISLNIKHAETDLTFKTYWNSSTVPYISGGSCDALSVLPFLKE